MREGKGGTIATSRFLHVSIVMDAIVSARDAALDCVLMNHIPRMLQSIL